MTLYTAVKSQGNFACFCRQFMHDEDCLVARNALWALTKTNKQEITQLQPLQNSLIDLAMTTANASIRRLSLNLTERLAMHKDNLRTDFLDFCLDHAIAVDESPGIQSLCMKLAFRMCRFYPELQEELLRILQAMEITYYKPSVKSVRNKILNGTSQPSGER